MYDVIVIGQGAMGLATTYALAKRGLKVLGLEQHSLFHELGSSHGESRAIRMAYFEHSAYIPLLLGAYALWTEIETQVREEIFKKCGVAFYTDPKSSEIYRGVCQSSEQYNIPVEKLSRQTAAKKFPYFQAPANFEVLFEANAGMIFVERALRAMAKLSQELGATLHDQEKVITWQDGAQIEVTTNKTIYTAKKIIFCGGGWTSHFAPKLPLRIFRANQYWFAAPESAKKYPCFGFHLEDDFYYGFPSLDGKSLKVAAHFNIEPLAKPEDKNIAQPNPKALQAITNFVKKSLPEVGNYLRFSPCIYTTTPDEHFILDKLSDNVFLAGGFSGHGFKFAPVIGEIMAELATTGASTYPIDFLSLKRFVDT